MASKLNGNRKGAVAIDEAIPALVFILCVVFVLLALFFLFPPSSKEKERTASLDIASNDAERTLVRALILPVDGVPVGNLIVDSYYKKDGSKQIILKQAVDTLSAVFSQWSPGGWVVVVKDSSSNVFFSIHRSQIYMGTDVTTMIEESWKEAANAQLPLIAGDGVLTVKLYSPDTEGNI